MRLINVLSDRADDVVLRSEKQLLCTHRVSSLFEVRGVLAQLEDAVEPSCLDLCGHSTRDSKLLRLGATIVDMCRPSVAKFFESLLHDGEMERLGIVMIRLLGCETAIEPAGQLTLKLLATTLGTQVYGTRRMIMRSHYNDHGFDPLFTNVLVEAAQLPSPPRRIT